MSPGNRVGIAELRVAAPAIGIQLVEVPVQTAQELDSALQVVASSATDALNINPDIVLNTQLMRILDFAAVVRGR